MHLNSLHLHSCLNNQHVAYSYSRETVEAGETSVSLLTPLSLFSSCPLLPLWSLRALKADTGPQLNKLLETNC